MDRWNIIKISHRKICSMFCFFLNILWFNSFLAKFSPALYDKFIILKAAVLYQCLSFQKQNHVDTYMLFVWKCFVLKYKNNLHNVRYVLNELHRRTNTCSWVTFFFSDLSYYMFIILKCYKMFLVLSLGLKRKTIILY